MKAFKKATVATFIGGTSIMLMWGALNSPVLNKSAFMSNKFNISFAKRLDEINGEVIKGRMAASLGNQQKWRSLSTNLIKEQAAKLVEQKVSTASAAPEVTTKSESNEEEVVQNKPAVIDTPRLSLTGGIFNKKPISVNGSEAIFTGSAKVTDGIVEELNITLPDGKTISIYALNERMNGNVFTYEDTGTGMLRSGLLYEVGGGVMVTLTDDSQYPGLRLEFKTGDAIAASNADESWNLNEQNNEEENYNDEQDLQDEYAQNEYTEQEENFDNEDEQEQAYGFTF